ncbi:hypothetical protein DYB26_009615 [Aphanomyces astaci]|uniref:Uncharacterized protein n=1 Tax=Aphanomyces astaci TaxID=112090 RepID=A0A3R7AQW0_APHAT|nr:hypothetical protein DYB26_009615 [Aphanomyces astaci]
MVVEGAICLDWGDLHALGLVGVALAECRGGQRFTAAMANIETSFRIVTPHRQYRLSYHRHWTVHTLLSHVISRHERRTVQDMTSQLFCIVGLDIDPSQQHDQVLALHQSMASVMDSSTPVRFKAILADRPAVVAVETGVTVACTLCQCQIPIELVEVHSHTCY